MNSLHVGTVRHAIKYSLLDPEPIFTHNLTWKGEKMNSCMEVKVCPESNGFFFFLN